MTKNEPYVAFILYRLLESEYLRFDEPPELEIASEHFKGKLSKGILKLEPKENYKSAEEILPLADEFVRRWELSASLEYNIPDFEFMYVNTHILDRKPDNNAAQPHDSTILVFSPTVKSTAVKKVYPLPPINLNRTDDTDILWIRYSKYLRDRDQLQSMAYCCLTLLENRTGLKSNRNKAKTKKAAKMFCIDFEVLDQLGDISSKKGDLEDARKIDPNNTQPFEGNERAWLESVIPAIIKHLATPEPRKQLTMDDIPV